MIELCYVMYLCRKMMTMYCCEEYIDYHSYLYVLNLNCYWFCCLYVHCFEGSPSGEAAKTIVI
jgi:hypothetical protein